MNIISYRVLKGPHKRSQYSSVWKQKKTEDEGGNNNTFRQSDKRVHTRGHGKVVHGKADDNNAIEADKKCQWSCLEQFLIL